MSDMPNLLYVCPAGEDADTAIPDAPVSVTAVATVTDARRNWPSTATKSSSMNSTCQGRTGRVLAAIREQ